MHLSSRRDDQIPQNLRYYALCECSKTLWSTFGQLNKDHIYLPVHAGRYFHIHVNLSSICPAALDFVLLRTSAKSLCISRHKLQNNQRRILTVLILVGMTDLLLQYSKSPYLHHFRRYGLSVFMIIGFILHRKGACHKSGTAMRSRL